MTGMIVCRCATESTLLVAFLFIVVLPSLTNSLSRDEIITSYFRCGYSYKLILCFLFGLHGIHLSLRQLKRILRRLGLRRRHPINFHVIDQSMRAIEVFLLAYLFYYFSTLHTQMELHGSGSLLGYRAMCRRLQQQNGIPVSRYL